MDLIEQREKFSRRGCAGYRVTGALRVALKELDRIAVVIYSLVDPAVATVLAQIQQEHARPVNLTGLYNASRLDVTSVWRDIDLSICLENELFFPRFSMFLVSRS